MSNIWVLCEKNGPLRVDSFADPESDDLRNFSFHVRRKMWDNAESLFSNREDVFEDIVNMYAVELRRYIDGEKASQAEVRKRFEPCVPGSEEEQCNCGHSENPSCHCSFDYE